MGTRTRSIEQTCPQLNLLYKCRNNPLFDKTILDYLIYWRKYLNKFAVSGTLYYFCPKINN
jgi:hypothetical protein